MVYFQWHGEAEAVRRLYGLRGSAGLHHLVARGGKGVVVTHDAKRIHTLAQSLRALAPEALVFELPPLDGSPFAFTPVHPQTRRDRLACFDALLSGRWDFIVTQTRMFLEPLAPREKLATPRLDLVAGNEYDLAELCRTLVDMGYLASDLVSQPGDFARRGGILDIYSSVDERAWRLDFWDDELEEIRELDPGTQRSIGQCERIHLLPLFEWRVGPDEAETFARKGGEQWNQTDARKHFLSLVAELRDRGRFSGYLHWAALFFPEATHLPDLISEPVTYYLEDWDGAQEIQEQYLTQLELQGEALGSGQLHAPLRVLTGRKDPRIVDLPETATALSLHHLKMERVDEEYITQSVPAYKNDVRRFVDHWKQQAKRLAIVVVSDNSGALKRLEETIEDDGFFVHPLTLPIPDTLEPGFYMARGDLETGFQWPDRHLVVLSGNDIWSKTPRTRKPAAGKKTFQAEFRDLKVGDFVVHDDYGIGKFLGLVEMEAGGASHEMMALTYKNDQKLYMSLNQIHLVQRFGAADSQVQLDKLGGTGWERTKTRVKRAVREMAGELIQLYAQRSLVTRHAYGPDTEWQAEFEEAFPHEPTQGQLTAISEIKRDLESTKPMDRLLVGDVGFGKTEVAMRMAFKVVMEGYQVAVLCPTTVLAFQHYHTFKNRFANFPVSIGWISRFSSPSATKRALSGLADGKVDIIVGTHRLLSKDIQFKNLGAVVIDEEQRFGVAHKERLKQFRKQIDVLSMSATPIPRTLNMSLSGIRDISVIETPPRNRLAISTTVTESREGTIKNAVEFELARGGQVFFIHNRVETMDQVVAGLGQLMPGLRISVAHGQMEPKRIEREMLAFMEHETDVLVASTIIENGVDIPNANTMIVNRSDMFGMSQLYQLRGRIGRSDRPAFAYLLVPPRARMSTQARMRLATLEEFSDLGAGFRIAARDMELRGAGNLLGGRQAGHINTIGYDMFVKLLEEAVSELRGTQVQDRIACLVNLNFGAAIPRRYVEETNQRLHYYKQLAGAESDAHIDEICEIMVDCYGSLDDPVLQLCREHRLRLFLAEHRVLNVERERDTVRLRFHETASVKMEVVLGWIQKGNGVTLTPEGVLTLPLPSKNPEEAIDFVRESVEALVGPKESAE
ncbi:Transcription-repair-coupling factor [Sulfidibacter corallicola]|uniref:Transcription-repair-coupling factor n=1 Tax=Sulfidibacter corallicola TaxID=2818388 RepID=A0A8A4TXY3_SULCO|nr:transcription-repair coupling factor [Sulfidibacter corallicola]QTD54091.1 transcription-repair coupling factor [Sulfidibacter corallicola]